MGAAELSLLEVGEDVIHRPFETLSNGEQTKVLLAVLFLQDNHFLLIDEPTNHLDVNARKIVSEYLKSKKGFILVSHDRAFLDNCIDHILSINKTNIEVQKGNFSSWLYNKKLQDEYELAENEKLKRIQGLPSNKTNGRLVAKLKNRIGRRNSGVKPTKNTSAQSSQMLKRSKGQLRRQAAEERQNSKILKQRILFH